MSKKQIKFGIGFLVVGSVLTWLAFTGFQESKAYYKFVDEVQAMGQDAYTKKLKMHGNVVDGSIRDMSGGVEFKLTRNGVTIPVKYVGSSPVPDTFKDGSEAVVDGRLTRQGIFEAHTIQAKCASKYESEYKAKS